MEGARCTGEPRVRPSVPPAIGVSGERTISPPEPLRQDRQCRLGGLQVRNLGTVCGNIANGSPIGDMPPPLIAVG